KERFDGLCAFRNGPIHNDDAEKTFPCGMFVVSNVERYSGFSAGHIQRLFRPNLDVESAVVWEVDRTRPVVVGIVVTTGVVREYLESALKPGAILKGCTGKSID